MTAPFYTAGLFGEETSLLVAVFIGIGFGFFLERAGFGSARKLVAQFYLTDLAVFKVMFTAIVTAMTGVIILGSFNLLDLSEVYLAPTYWGPQIVGGLLLGAGFVIGGYCPGTSIAAVATGRVDGLVCALGIGAGTLAFSAAFPQLESFYLSGSAGEITLPQLLDLPAGLVASGVVVMAIAGFYGASRIERHFADSSHAPQQDVS
ncbi:MAG: YeeE/YedE family protein [Vicinamibacteria bacterium]|nr:YeeE/YedE family protein [Vicinamibacteria bacterium]